jgi:hypothetical protein
MNRYALIVNGSVDMVVEQNETPTVFGSTWIDVTGMNVGPQDLYDGASFTKYVPSPEPRVISKVAFRFRLTDSEYVGILSAAKTDVEVAAWIETFNMSTTIDLDNQRTKDGVQNLVGKNLLTQARADEILNAPVQPGER